MEYFKIKKLGFDVTQIRNDIGDCMYLLEGGKKAALIDTGTGYGRLADFVKKITKLPVVVLLTHGHLDHAGGIYEFDDIYVNSNDIELIKRHTTYENRADYVKEISPELYHSLSEEAYSGQKAIEFRPIYEGDVIDLGNRQLEVVETPGHTAGSLCYIDRKNRLAFTGDACCVRTLLFSEVNGVSVKLYLRSLKKFLQFMPEMKKMYWGHYDGILTNECVWNVFESCIDILNGQDEKVPFTFMNVKGFSAHSLMPDNLNRLDGKIGNIIYGPDML